MAIRDVLRAGLKILVPGLLSMTAIGEVKPMDSVLASECGTTDQQVQVCRATAQFSGRDYIIITDTSERAYYIAMQKSPSGIEGIPPSGGVTEVYRGIGVGLDKGAYLVEKEYELTVKTVAVPGADKTGSLTINGKSVGRDFRFAQIFHTATDSEE